MPLSKLAHADALLAIFTPPVLPADSLAVSSTDFTEGRQRESRRYRRGALNVSQPPNQTSPKRKVPRGWSESTCAAGV